MDVYDVRDDTLIDLAREAAKRGWWHAFHQRRGVRDSKNPDGGSLVFDRAAWLSARHACWRA